MAYFKAFLVLLSLVAHHPTEHLGWPVLSLGGDSKERAAAQRCSKLDVKHPTPFWLWVLMGEPGLLFLHAWEQGGDVGCGTTHISAPTLSPHNSGRACLFALFLSAGKKSHYSCHNGEKKMHCPLAIVISITAIWESRRHCLFQVSCGHAQSAISADTDLPAYVEISGACMIQRTKQTR